MFTLNVHLSSDEWDRVRRVVAQWPTETLSNTELGRRLILYGADAIMHLRKEEQERVARKFRQSLNPDGSHWHGKLPRLPGGR